MHFQLNLPSQKKILDGGGGGGGGEEAPSKLTIIMHNSQKIPAHFKENKVVLCVQETLTPLDLTSVLHRTMHSGFPCD